MTKPLIVSFFLIFFCGKLFAQAPIVSSFSPASGPVGSTVTISGSNFNSTAANNLVFFGTVKATVLSANSNSLQVTVPAGASYQSISVINTATSLTAYSRVPFVPTFSSKKSITQADFDQNQMIANHSSAQQALVADVDGDGKPDVLSVLRNNDWRVAVYRNISPGNELINATDYTLGAMLSASKDSNGGSAADQIAVGDLNGDGLPDVVIVSYYTNSLTIYINNSTPGLISFQSPVTLIVALNFGNIDITSAAIGDIDGDGKPDIVAVAGYNIAIIQNTSAGGKFSLGAETDINDTDLAQQINIADIDGDGKPDLVYATSNRFLSIQRNTSSPGNVSFARDAHIYTTNVVTGLALADLNNDGKPDIVLTNQTTKTISIYQNQSTQGHTVLASNVDFPSGQVNGPISIADLDGDGLPDIVMGSDYGADVYRNITAGNVISLSPFVLLNTGIALSISIADMNADGKPDLIITFSGAFTIMQNDPKIVNNSIPPRISSINPSSGPVGTTVTVAGSGFNTSTSKNIVFFGATRAVVNAATSTSLTATVPPGTTFQPTSVLNTDINLSGYSAFPFITTFQSNGKGPNYDGRVSFASGNAPTSVAIGDLDGDGKPDLVVANGNSNTISVYRNTSSNGSIIASSFTTKIDYPLPAGPSIVKIADLNADGKPDIVVGCNRNSNALSFFRNTSTAGQISFAPTIDYLQSSGVNDIAIADIDNDGMPDVVVVFNMNTVDVFHNVTTGGNANNLDFLAENLNLQTNTGPESLCVADFDHDGKPDIAVAVSGVGYQFGFISLFRNTTAGQMSFSSSNYSGLGQWPACIKTADMDGDGKPDLVLGLSNDANSILVLPNNSTPGNISFGAKQVFEIAPGNFELGDVDGDGKPDIISTVPSNGLVSVVTNASSPGKFSFNTANIFPTGNFPVQLAIGDLDGDGKPDIVTADNAGNTMSILHYDANALPVPAITIVNPLVFKSGGTISITGLNLTGATSVTFGGTPVKSFTVVSPKLITAVIGNGSSGTIAITTPGGTAYYNGAVYVPTPTITVNGPTTFLTGESVDLTAEPASPSIGFYTYQWYMDGNPIYNAVSQTYTATQSGIYTVAIIAFTVSQISTQKVAVTVNFALPNNNFSLSITSATCKGSNDGSVTITAAQNLNYTATITGNSLNTPYPFTTSATIPNLAAGTYHICVTVAGQAGYQQCYDAVITEPKDLSVYSTINETDKSITLAMTGGNQYNIQLNGTDYSTTDSSITLPLADGNNDLTVTTDKLCQGALQKMINISGKISPYPVPFQNMLSLNLGNTPANNVSVEIHDVSDGKLVYSKDYGSQSGVLKLDVAGLEYGVYVLHLKMNNTEKVFKIIKQ
ncbi:MAG TPA: FG-GAP-like repeat-containing protein [Mucilaginibacter sp.]|nr:FG-GAP-like repeat-containing protein [Mucilaginibacter sp.]